MNEQTQSECFVLQWFFNLRIDLNTDRKGKPIFENYFDHNQSFN